MDSPPAILKIGDPFVADRSAIMNRFHGLAVPTWVKRVKQKKILAENLGQVVQDVKFEFSRTEKSTWVRWQKLANLKYWYKIIFY